MTKMPKDKASKMQAMLNKVIKPKPPLAVDGIVGPLTEAAIKTLQKRSKLPATGKIDGETAIVIVRGIKTGKLEKEVPTKYLRLPNGTYAGFTDKEYERMRKKLIKDLKKGPVLEMKQAIEAARAEWDYFDKLNKDQWFVSFCVETTRGASLPKASVITKAEKLFNKIESLAIAGDFEGFARHAPQAAREVNNALDAIRTYRSNMIEGGENWVTGLEATKWTSFTALSIMMPAAGTTLGASALSTAVVGGAALKATETAAGEIGNWGAGTPNTTVGGSISKVLIDGGIGAITGYLTKGAGGKHFLDASSGYLAKQLIAKVPAFKALSEKAVLSFAAYLIREGGKSSVKGIISDIGKLAKDDKNMTMDKFAENFAKNFAKGFALGPVSKIVEKYSLGKNLKLDKKDVTAIQKNALSKLMKDLDGKTVFIDKVKDEVAKSVLKELNGLVTRTIKAGGSKSLDKVFESLSGSFSPAEIDKKLKAELITETLKEELAKQIADKTKKKVAKLKPA